MRLEELTPENIDYILDNLDHSRLSNWEQEFIESISDQWERSRHLSDRQREKLGQIWDKQP